MELAFKNYHWSAYDFKQRPKLIFTFRFDGFSVWRDEDGGHHAEGAVALSNRVRLDVAVVILAGPDEPALRFHGLNCLNNVFSLS